MGRHSNIILLDKESKKIIDSIKHISAAQSSVRTVLPGQTYEAPPAQGKVNPFSINEEEFSKKIDFNSGKLDKQIMNVFSGISPMVAKEIVHRAGLANRETLTNAFFEIIEPLKANQYEPQMIITDTKELFTILPLSHVQGEVKSFETLSELLDRFYYGKAERDRVKQQAHDLERFLKNELEKNKKKIKQS
jgi:predicted ribosome quality control (RQC) complex YloA/Tae2 family protein